MALIEQVLYNRYMIPLILADLVQETAPLPHGDYGAAFAKMFLSLIFLVALLLLTYWLIKRVIQQRLQRGVGTQAIQIIEKRMISPKTTLYLIEVEQKIRVLVAESQLEIKKIETLDQKEDLLQ